MTLVFYLLNSDIRHKLFLLCLKIENHFILLKLYMEKQPFDIWDEEVERWREKISNFKESSRSQFSTYLEPLCRIKQAAVFSSIFWQSWEMNLGWTLKDLMVSRPAKVSEKWENTGARLRLSSRCSSRDEHLQIYILTWKFRVLGEERFQPRQGWYRWYQWKVLEVVDSLAH